MREYNLNNNIRVCIKENKNTPRVALTINLSISKQEKNPGEYILMNRLLLKGTEKYSSEELSVILDENAIDLSTEMKSDYLRFRFVCLNEDFEKALAVLQDVILNSTFAEFEKEKTKLKGELTAELDSAKVKVSDLFTKTIYKNHFYGHSYTKVLEVNGVGYRAAKSGNKLTLSLGYSHPVEMTDPEGLETVLEGQNKITVKGIDKEKVGQYAAEIRDKRRPEPYKGKGIKYADEVIRRKVGKTGKK